VSTPPLRVWLVDDDASIRWVLERALKGGGMSPRIFESAESALEAPTAADHRHDRAR
jgi:two-component system, NtrC family, nitrogen regulation response regulator GlnG